MSEHAPTKRTRRPNRLGRKPRPEGVPVATTVATHMDTNGGVHGLIVWWHGDATSFYLPPEQWERIRTMFDRAGGEGKR